MVGGSGLGWAIVVAATELGNNPTWHNWLLSTHPPYPIYTACAFILAGFTDFDWLLPGSLLSDRQGQSKVRASSHSSNVLSASWLLFGAAFSFQWVYAQAYGSLVDLFAYSASLRSAALRVDNPLTFLQPFGGLALFASFGFFGVVIAGRRSLGVMVGLALSFRFSLYVLYSWLGRIRFLVSVLTLFLGLVLFRRPRPIALPGVGAFGLAGVVAGAYGISAWLNLKIADNVVELLARELSFPFVGFFAQPR
jgi:hypothetical protein